MAEYRISGELETGVESLLPTESARVVVKQAVRIDAAVRDGGTTATLTVDKDDLLEVELENGFVLWTTIERLDEDTKHAGTRDRNDTTFPAQYPLQRRGTERGTISDAIRAVKVLGYDLPREGAVWAAGKVEEQLEGDGQFFRIASDGALTREDPAPTRADEATLVMIHGTASSTANAYSGFFNENIGTWEEIHDRYEGRVYGFEHRTLTKSPLENALEFLNALPEDANLHLVTHSRGGLVGDLIAHGGVTGDAFDMASVRDELKAYADKPEVHEKNLADYQAFNRLIASVGPNVQRYVRVGCPAAGTTLASRRLDIYLSIIVNLLKRVPAVGPILGGLGELAAAVAKERTEPDALPGLEAQMPSSPFIRLLNTSKHVLESDLTVLAGDSDGFFKNLVNIFYWRANDLVVDTRSMYGGVGRARRLWHLEENRHVTHVNYFRRAETAAIVQRGLFRGDADTSGFAARKPKGVERGRVTEGKPDENTDLPGVVMLPGIMGSNLAAVSGNKRNRIWLDVSDLLKGRGRKLAMDSNVKIEPAGVLDSPYEDFRDYLVRQGMHVMPVAYDWRLSLEEAVVLLRKVVSKRLAASNQPVYLIAHSMGGLVASLFIANDPDGWRTLRDRGGRLVQAGTPNLGSYVILRILQGQEKLVRWLAKLDRNGVEQWAEWTSRFRGILDLAPNFDDLDFSKVSTWQQLGVKADPRAADLRAAQKVWDALKSQTEKLAGEGVLYVAGGPEPTPIYDADAGKIRFTERGDGRVTWASGIPPEAPTWYIPVKHGSLLDTSSAFSGLRELLVDGRTDQLATEAPPASARMRGEPLDEPILAADEELEFIPSRDDLEAAALGMDDPHLSPGSSAPPVTPCEVSVVHGDLRFTGNPVVVGHYRGDPIVNAERALDGCLDGALRSRHQLGVYPGAIGTAEVLLKKGADVPRRHYSPTGAIVLGLGNVGDLTPGGLTRSVQAGLLRYAQARRDHGLDTTSLKVSALLVGSGEAGITMHQTLEAFLDAVNNTNRLLKMQSGDSEGGTDPQAPLTHFAALEFIELYKDMALEAIHALRELRDRPEFLINEELVTRGGGWQRPRTVSDQSWWSRIQIREDDADRKDRKRNNKNDITQTLTYMLYGDRARAPEAKITVQRPLVDRLVAETLESHSGANSGFPETLFELVDSAVIESGCG